MSTQTLAWVILWILIILILVASFVIAYIYGKVSVKDKNNEAWVFVKTGLHVNKPLRAKISETASKGLSFIYNKKVVMLPSTYKEHYYRNKRMVFVNHKGQLIASPIADDVALSESEKESLIYEMCSCHVGSDGMKALKGKSTTSVIVIALAAFVIGIAAVIGFNAFQQQMAKRQGNVPQQQLEQPVEVR